MTRDNPRYRQAPATAPRNVWLKKLEDVEVIIIAEPSNDLRTLLHELQILKMHVHHIWPAPSIVPGTAEILVCGYLDNLVQRFGWLPGCAPLSLVLLVPEGPCDLDTIINAAPDSILSAPFTANAVAATMAHALNQFRYARRMNDKILRLEDGIHSIRIVERAKSILMKKRNLSEEQAYSEIRKYSMNKRVSVATIAKIIVDSFELLGSSEL